MTAPLTREEAKAKLAALNQAIATAVVVLKTEREILDRYFVESRDFDTLGPILDPTLWNSTERRVTDALLRPVYEAAANCSTSMTGNAEKPARPSTKRGAGSHDPDRKMLAFIKAGVPRLTEATLS